jgi:hypothetical protein
MGLLQSPPRHTPVQFFKKKKKISETTEICASIADDTVKDKYPLPLVEDQLDYLGGDGKGGEFIKYFREA